MHCVENLSAQICNVDKLVFLYKLPIVCEVVPNGNQPCYCVSTKPRELQVESGEDG